mgnify:CR=1 FL=1
MPSDPRVFFASERTLLAWLRTGVALIGLGFVVSRFGLFLRLMRAEGYPMASASSPSASNAIGIALVLLGALCIGAACIQHARFIATLPAHDMPARYSRTWAIVLATLTTLGALALAIYLLLVPA